MLQTPGFDFGQTYIDHGYIELCIPPVEGKVFDSKLILRDVKINEPKIIDNWFLFAVSNGGELLAYLAARTVHDDCTTKSR